MKNIFYKGIAGLAMLLWFCCLPVSAQNFYIEILDAETYQPIQDVKVEMESASTKITFYSSPFGGVSDNVPAGVYTVTMSRSGYLSRQETNIRILAHELNTFTFRMTTGESMGGDQGGGKGLRLTTSNSKVPVNKGFLDLGYQFGSIQVFHLGAGWFFWNNFFAEMKLAYGRQEYSSPYFINHPRPDMIGFNRIMISTGYKTSWSMYSHSGIFLKPNIGFAFEAIKNKNLLSNVATSYVMNLCLLPEVRLGFYYRNISFFTGINYSYWLLPAFNESRNVFKDAYSGERLSWSSDFFPQRKGFGITTGFSYSF